MRVLLVHNRYRFEGGEERSVELQAAALGRASVTHAVLERSSTELSRPAAALALLRGGRDVGDVEAATRELEADVVHVHNMLPAFGPRSLAAAREAGAAVVLHLHNLRLFCAIGVAARDGGPASAATTGTRCRASRSTAASPCPRRWCTRPRWRATSRRCSRTSTGSWCRASTRRSSRALLGVPGDRIDVLPHYLPAEAFAERSRAGDGAYALVASRLASEKGIDTAIRAATLADIPLRVAGEGPAAAELVELANVIGGRVDFIGRQDRAGMERELAGAAMVVMPSALPRVLAVLGAGGDGRGRAGRGVAPRRPAGADRRRSGACRRTTSTRSPRAMRILWTDAERRTGDGDALLERARENHPEERYTRRLLDLYERVRSSRY